MWKFFGILFCSTALFACSHHTTVQRTQEQRENAAVILSKAPVHSIVMLEYSESQLPGGQRTFGIVCKHTGTTIEVALGGYWACNSDQAKDLGTGTAKELTSRFPIIQVITTENSDYHDYKKTIDTVWPGIFS